MIANFRTRAAALVAALSLAGCVFSPRSPDDATVYLQRNLVADSALIPAEHIDPNLVDAWGIAFNQFGVVWVSANRTGTSTLYDGDGNPQTLVVNIPPAVAGSTGNPSGIVFYGGPGFIVRQGTLSGPSRFIFSSEDGSISGWAPGVNLTNAIRVVNNTGAIYKGLAISAGGSRALLYATDFRNNRIDVFDTSFAPVALPGAPFRDPHLPSGFAPFGVQAINGDIYVTYAKQNADRTAHVSGFGHGFISVFSPNGEFVRRFASGGVLNAPWGIAQAPASFGHFGNRLLVANHGDGAFNAFDVDTGFFVGRLRGKKHKPIEVDGLWGLSFGNGLVNQPTNTLFFTAGPDDGRRGLYGRLDVDTGDDHDYTGDLR